MAALEPTSDELVAIVDFGTAADWAGLQGDATDDTTPRGSLLALLGAAGNPSVSVRLLGNIPEVEWDALLVGWRLGDPLAAASPVVKSAGALVGRVCRLRVGTQQSQVGTAAQAQIGQQLQQAQAQLAQAQAGQLSTAARLKVKLSQVLSQTYHDSVEAHLLDQGEIDRAYARYEVIFGEGKLPSAEKTPTREQMSAFKFALDTGDFYADFCVFGPHGNRLLRKLRLSGQVFDRDGTLRTIEMVGPPCYDIWLSSAHVLGTLIIMFDAMDFGTFENYLERQKRYHSRYGARCWHLQYQTDVRTRSEKASRILAEGARARSRLQPQQQQQLQQQQGVAHPLDPARPWQWVFEQLEDHSERWWKEEFEEPAALLLGKIASAADVLGGDVLIGQSFGAAPASQQLGANPALDHAGSKRKDSRGSAHNVINGLHVTNRQRVELCDGYNSGSCATDKRWPGQCPVDWGKAHQCNKCLDMHPGSGCTKTPSENSRSKFLKTGGKDRGKGSGKGKRKY